MAKHRASVGWAFALVATLAVLGPGAPSTAFAGDEEWTVEQDGVVVGGQDRSVDAEEARDAKFERNRDLPGGLVIDWFQYSSASGGDFLQVKGWDATQRDERFHFRAGFGDKVRLEADYQRTPHRIGDGAVFVLGRGADDPFGVTYRIADFVQQDFEDPDGDGAADFPPGFPFVLPGGAPAAPNDAVQVLANDLLTGQDRFGLELHRRSGGVDLSVSPTRNWSFDVNLGHESKTGMQPLSTGTYQRITDVNNDTITDYDYFFSVRGIEMPAIIDYRTSRAEAFANYRTGKWFVSFGGSYSEFDNRYAAITYDNPFWFTDTLGSPGSRRGLWEQGRVSLEPSNEAWAFTVSGGVDLPGRTRITGVVSVGEHKQNEPFLPLTTSTANIAVLDLNGDTMIDAADDPTTTAVFGTSYVLDGSPTIGTSLDAKSDTTLLNLTVTSRPVDGLTLTGRFRSYEYEGTEGIQAVPAYVEYVESRIIPTFKGDTLLHVPLDFTRETIDLEAAYRFNKSFKLMGFARRKTYDYEQYRNTDAAVTRDLGNRAVSGTDDDTFGLGAIFSANSWLSGRVTLQTSDREYDGVYTPGFSGELPTMRQYDIANRERDAAEVWLDFMPADEVTLGVGYSRYKDDYPDTLFGLQEGKEDVLSLNVNYMASEKVNLFAYVESGEYDADMHLRTKCSNCSARPADVDPADPWEPWDVRNFDWFTDYKDSSMSLGAGVSVKAGERTHLEIQTNYLKGQIEQATRNPGTPIEENPANPIVGTTAGVALGRDFPDQENTLLSGEVRLTYRMNDRASLGFWYLFEDFELDDFQWDVLQPYAANFLEVDDATRHLFLDSRYRDYTAHVFQVFFRFRL